MRRRPFLSRADRRALLLLEWVLVLVVLGFFVYSWTQEDSGKEPAGQRTERTTKQHTSKSQSKGKTYIYATEEAPVETFPFDPNTADSTQLLRLGLAPWQVRAIYHYRAKHGRYHTPEDFARTPGMTNEMWKRLSPQIRIAERYRYVDAEAIAAKARESRPSAARTQSKASAADTASTLPARSSSLASSPSVPRDTIQRPVKYESLVQVDLATADTNQLKKIPGIASYRASQIVRYRESLGGFVSVEQVMESCSMPDDVLDWFCLSHTRTRKVNLNKASVQSMRRHPYISFYQARAIYERRTDKGPLRSPSDLESLKEFTPRDIERLQPYIEF